MEKILEINNLSVVYGSIGKSFTAADNLSFSLLAGETLGIVGESGSGKSTAALALMRLINQSLGKIISGEILYYKNGNKVEVLKLTDSQLRGFRRREAAMIFQEPLSALNPVLTCGFQITEAIRLNKQASTGESRVQAIQLLKKVQIDQPDRIFDAYPHQLSGGQRQRVLIAMAISGNPSILIADEPTSSLDIISEDGILKLLKSLQQELSMSMIFISHDLEAVAAMADRVMVMQQGKKIEENVTVELFRSPKHPYTRSLIDCSAAFNKDVKENQAPGDLVESQTPILSVEHLRVLFNTQHSLFQKKHEEVNAVDDMSFGVYRGETLGIVGESGCGKSTLARAMLRLIEPDSGKVIFNKTDISLADEQELREQRKHLQIIFQDPHASLNPKMRVGETLMEPLEVHRIQTNGRKRKEDVMDLLVKVKLPESFFHRYPYQLSGGERQRVCIARTLAVNPQFIICDEVVSSLDMNVQAQILDLLNELKQKLGLTYIFISHDLQVIRYMSDRIMVMRDGSIVEIGSTEDVYRNPNSDYTRKLITANQSRIEYLNNAG